MTVLNINIECVCCSDITILLEIVCMYCTSLCCPDLTIVVLQAKYELPKNYFLNIACM